MTDAQPQISDLQRLKLFCAWYNYRYSAVLAPKLLTDRQFPSWEYKKRVCEAPDVGVEYFKFTKAHPLDGPGGILDVAIQIEDYYFTIMVLVRPEDRLPKPKIAERSKVIVEDFDSHKRTKSID